MSRVRKEGRCFTHKAASQSSRRRPLKPSTAGSTTLLGREYEAPRRNGSTGFSVGNLHCNPLGWGDAIMTRESSGGGPANLFGQRLEDLVSEERRISSGSRKLIAHCGSGSHRREVRPAHCI